MRALRPTVALFLAACGGARVAPPASPRVPSPAVMPAPDARAALKASIDSSVGTPEFRNAHWGILIVDPARGETLYTRNADKLFMPASNQKIITGSVALTQLGPEYRWSTTVLARGPIRRGVLDGDLVVRGDGDPSISSSMRGDALIPLRDLADSLRARGITRIRGRIVAAPSPFTDAPLGYGWAWDDLDEPYGAGVDALYFNEGFTQILVRAGARPGDPVRATTRPASTYPPLIVRATTIARPVTAADSARLRPSLTAGYDSSHTGVLVAGTIAAGDTAVLELAFRDHPAAFLAAFREALRSRGIAVDEARRDSTAAIDSLVTLRSPPLRDVMRAFEKPSQNQIGELLFKTIALRATGVGRADTARRVVESQLVTWGAERDGFAVRDGSGLSRHDYVSPRTLVKALDAMRRHPEFRVFYDALPIAGVDGTIDKRMRGTPAQGNVHAKTGYIDKARSLSGYVTTPDGQMLIFSMLCNNYSVPTATVNRVQDSVAARLASLRLPTP
ncbi:MAG: D-alanyl-D-alanine carboxypeptidase/D-alanyl-D-alanine-endopeptidase [Gemmatimonadaceae bacterium]